MAGVVDMDMGCMSAVVVGGVPKRSKAEGKCASSC